jgi:thymidine kinase
MLPCTKTAVHEFHDRGQIIGTLTAYCDILVNPLAVCTHSDCGKDASKSYYLEKKSEAADVGGSEK